MELARTVAALGPDSALRHPCGSISGHAAHISPQTPLYAEDGKGVTGRADSLLFAPDKEIYAQQHQQPQQGIFVLADGMNLLGSTRSGEISVSSHGNPGCF
jgi:hypothetical protein